MAVAAVSAGDDPDILKRLRDGGRPKEERRRAVAWSAAT